MGFSLVSHVDVSGFLSGANYASSPAKDAHRAIWHDDDASCAVMGYEQRVIIKGLQMGRSANCSWIFFIGISP